MNTHPPAVSSSSTQKQQGEKRKHAGDSEQPQQLPGPTQNPEAHSSSATRQRIVEILSNTANGCLSELGYYPGMPMKLKELEAQNATWQDENIKLFQDNQRLLNTVRSLKATDSLTSQPKSAHLQRILDLEGEIRRLQAENERIRKLVQVPEALQVEYAKLVESQNALQNSYLLVCEENRRLAEQLRSFIRAQPLQTVPQHDPRHQQTISTAPYNSQRFDMPLPHSSTQSITPPQGYRPFSSSPGPVSLPQIINHPEPKYQLIQTQTAVLQNRQSHSNPPSRRSSLNIVNPLNPHQQVHSRIIDPLNQFNFSAPQTHSPNEQQHGNAGTPASMIPAGRSIHQNIRRASFPVAHRNGPFVQSGQPQPPMISFEAAEPPPSSATTASFNRSRRTETPPAPLHPSRVISPQSQMAAPTLSSCSVTSPSQHTEHSQPTASTIFPQDTYIRPPDVTQPQPITSTAIPLQPQSITAIQHQQNTQTRNEQQIPKTLSVDGSSSSVQQFQPTNNSSIPTNTLPFTNQNPPEGGTISTDVQNRADAMHVDAPDEEQDMEQESDVGPDGLRLLQICLEDLYGEPDQNGRLTCKLCLHRYQQNIQETAPTTFVNATDEELVAHAVAEHKHAWEHLRQPEAEGQDATDISELGEV